jgi:hypothetical protein
MKFFVELNSDEFMSRWAEYDMFLNVINFSIFSFFERKEENYVYRVELSWKNVFFYSNQI